MHFLLFLASLVSVTSTIAAPIPRNVARNEPAIEKRIPSTWYHPRSHPVHRLFKRQDDTDYDFDDEDADNGEYKYDEEVNADAVGFPEVGTPGERPGISISFL